MTHNMRDDDSIRVPTSITVNVVISGTVKLALDGHAVLEILSTTDDAARAIAAQTARLAAPTAILKDAIDTNPVPKP